MRETTASGAGIATFGEPMVPASAIDAIKHGHAEEVARLTMELVACRVILQRNGLEPPTRTGEQWLNLFRVCARVIQAASDLLGELGSAKELLET